MRGGGGGIECCFLVKTSKLALPGIMIKLFEPRHEISTNVECATSKASDQPAHMRSLIRAFACRLNNLWVLSY